MTSQTSEHGGLVYGLSPEGDSAGDFVSAAVTRDVVVNGLNHLLDVSGRVMVNFAVTAATDIELVGPPGAAESPAIMCTFSFPDFPIRAGDESSHRLVINMRASVAAAGTATFRLSLRPNSAALLATPPDPATTPSTMVAEVSTSSTTGEDLEAVIYLAPPNVRSGMWTTVQSVGYEVTDEGLAALYAGGTPPEGSVTEVPRSAHVFAATFQIYAKSTDPAARPRILSLTAITHPGERD